jgi:hypothetical protein
MASTAETQLSVRQHVVHAAPEPHPSIRSAEQVDLITAQFETSSAEVGKCFYAIDSELDSQVFVSEQLVEHVSNGLL